MRRRSFLKTAASILPAAGLHDLLAMPQPGPPAPTSELHFVGAGEDRSGQAHATAFSTMLFKVLPAETAGALFLLEHQHMKHGGPPLHLHLAQEEWFYVMEGQVAFQVGEQRLTLKPGESVLAPRLVAHTFSAVSDTPARMLIAFSPACKMEQFFRDNNGGIPEHDRAALFARYDMKYIGPSPFLKS